jgi:hypothetical protein
MININVLLLIVVQIIVIIFLIIALIFSDRSKQYKMITIISVIILIILEYPHMLISDPYFIVFIFDITVHIAAGISIFMLVSNFRFIQKKRRSYISLLMVIIFIVGIEIFLSILDIITTFINPNTWNIAQDIGTTVLGGFFGFLIYNFYESKRNMFTKVSF